MRVPVLIGLALVPGLLVVVDGVAMRRGESPDRGRDRD
jgi:hypothetical protein